MSRLACSAVLLIAAAGCARDTTKPASTIALSAAADSVRKDSLARARQDSINRTLPGYVIDSILPTEELLRRFRARVGGAPVTALQHASDSRDALIARFMKAVAASDSASLRDMALNAREFADLVYPESPNTKPPYKEDPAVMWTTIQNPSQGGFIRLVRRTAEIPTTLVDYRCDGKTEKQGRNTFISGCTLRLNGKDGVTTSHRYFGSIIERDHMFKIVSYRNEF